MAEWKIAALGAGIGLVIFVALSLVLVVLFGRWPVVPFESCPRKIVKQELRWKFPADTSIPPYVEPYLKEECAPEPPGTPPRP